MYLSSKLYQVPVVLVVAPLSAETDPKDLDIATKQTIHSIFILQLQFFKYNPCQWATGLKVLYHN